MKGRRLKDQEEEEFVPKAFKKDKAIDKTEVNLLWEVEKQSYSYRMLHKNVKYAQK